MKQFLTSCLITLVTYFPAYGEWVNVQGSSFFGPETAQSTACLRAEAKAKRTALEQTTGERLLADDLMICNESSEQSNCTLNRLTWSLADGEIRSIKNRTSSLSEIAEGVRKCTVHLQADIATERGFHDASFDLGVTLNQSMFRPGEELTLSLAPSQPMYIQVFQWLPYEEDQPVLRIFPNRFEKDAHFKGAGTIPRSTHKESYALALAPPAHIQSTQRHWDEYLMIIATRQPLSLRSQYSLTELRTKLLEIPRSDSRIIKKGYTILGGSL
ncbi:DUF4384 domain-containing protein [Terasakiella sp. SH-1]|uniref:DUF4384 domain-containing protein n=1 Tax=Terasakiella sp. SH-1 TaxID=2560057 RepID=UPI0014322703|nr:DUF4384 domain-containing protein [Terasakiella sp. SH-1]